MTWLLVCLLDVFFFVPFENFYSYEDVTITDKGLQIWTYMQMLGSYGH